MPSARLSNGHLARLSLTAIVAVLGATCAVFISNSQGRALAPSCASATLSRQAESGGTLAFLDAGVGKNIDFVCIQSIEFEGGEGGPYTLNGAVANGCFAIDGVGTEVVAVFREDPAVVPGCELLTGIRAGLGVRGDANCNGTADALDALFVLRVLADLEQPTAECGVSRADTDNSGSLDVRDAMLIRRRVAGLP